MTCVRAPCRRLLIWIIHLAMCGMAGSSSLRAMQPIVANNHQFTREMLGENVKVYGPPSSYPIGSLILLMGYGADLSWTLSQWWYLHPAWAPSDQEWCKNMQPPRNCVFDITDKVATQNLRSHLRIVDAVGTIVLAEKSHAWYRYTHWYTNPVDVGPPVATEFEKSVANVFDLIEREYKIVGSYDRIAIAGMSQGADLALEVGIRFPHQLAMVVSQRGVLIPSRTQGNLSLPANQNMGTPFILMAGDSDEITPPSVYRTDCATLQIMQSTVHFKMYPGLDHGSFSKPEWKVMMNAFSLMLAPDVKAAQIPLLTTWDPCIA